MTAAASQDPDPPRMLARSFYMRSDVAERLAGLIDDLHYATHRRHHEVIAALVDVTEQHRSEIELRLRRGSSPGSGEPKDGASR